MPLKKVSAPRRQGWLDRCEAGASEEEIARESKLDVRTVRKHLQLAQEERSKRQALIAFVRDALERHQADLLAILRFVKSRIPLYPENASVAAIDYELELVEGDRTQYRLFLALKKEHMRGERLWKALDKWHSLAQSWREAQNQGGSTTELARQLQRQSEVVHEELDKTLLKRIVPGRCRYCPA